jgi:hypothetical protein
MRFWTCDFHPPENNPHKTLYENGTSHTDSSTVTPHSTIRCNMIKSVKASSHFPSGNITSPTKIVLVKFGVPIYLVLSDIFHNLQNTLISCF